MTLSAMIDPVIDPVIEPVSERGNDVALRRVLVMAVTILRQVVSP